MSEQLNCANCGERIGKLETPRVFNDQVVCGHCLKLLTEDAAPASAVITPSIPEYESAADTRRRLRGGAASQPTRPSALILIGRVIFGFLAAGGLLAAIVGKFFHAGSFEDERTIYSGITVFFWCAVIFFATFLKRVF